MGYKWAEHVFGVRCHIESRPENRSASVSLYTQGDAPIYYTLDGSEPDCSSILYEGPFEINETCVLKASAYRDGKMTRPFRQNFSFHKSVGRNIALTHPSLSEYSSKTGEGLVDGIRGPAIHKSKEWCCWKAKPFEAVIDMNACEPYSRVEIGYFSNKPSQIFNPLNLSVSVSDDGQTYKTIAAAECPPEGEFDPDGLKNLSVTFPETSARYLKVKAECMEYVPSWHHYAGRKASLYIDEVIVD
jgi:hexosaminidase